MSWKRGITLITPQTKDWSKEQMEKSNLEEQSMIFSNFSPMDYGKSRQRVCILNYAHEDYEDNAKIIENAPTMLRLLRSFEKIKDLWLPENVSEEHAGEAKALHEVRNQMLEILKKCEKINFNPKPSTRVRTNYNPKHVI